MDNPDIRDMLIHRILNSTKHFVNNQKQHQIFNIDRDIAKHIKTTKLFIKENPQLLFTNAEKGNVTVLLNKDSYQKMSTMLNDKNIYEKLEISPEKNIK